MQIWNPEKTKPSQDMSIRKPEKKTRISGHVHLLIHVSLYKSSGLEALVSAQQLQRNLIRNPEKNPHLRTCLSGTQKRKTHLRTWQSGTQEKKTPVSGHVNQEPRRKKTPIAGHVDQEPRKKTPSQDMLIRNPEKKNPL
jgi:hypothetical protein